MSKRRDERPGHAPRTPEEDRFIAEQRARICGVLDQAARDGASYILAVRLGEPAEVARWWLNAVWDGLRGSLSDVDDHPTLRAEDRLTAIVMLLEDRMNAEVGRLLDGLERGRP